MRYLHKDYTESIYIDNRRYVPLHKISALLHSLKYYESPFSSEINTEDIFSDEYITILDMYNMDDFSIMRKNIVNTQVKRTAQYFINYSSKSSKTIYTREASSLQCRWPYYAMDKDVYILFYRDYLIKINFKKENISLLGVLAMDCELMSEDMQDINFFTKDNPIVNMFKNQRPENINPSIGLFLDYDFYEYYMTSRRRGAYMIKAIDRFTELRLVVGDFSFTTNVYPVNDLSSLILKNYNYKKLSNSVKAQNPAINEYDIVTNLHLAFQNKASVDFITNKFNNLFND